MWLKSVLIVSGLASCLAAVGGEEPALRNEIGKPDFVEKQLSARSKQIASLILLVKDPTLPRASRIKAVQLLGGIRAVEAVDVLLHLTIIAPERVKEAAPELMAPCMPALVAIGKQSSDKALSELAKESDVWRRFLLLTILRRVEGDKLAQYLLQEALRSVAGASEKANLQAALDEFTKEKNK